MGEWLMAASASCGTVLIIWVLRYGSKSMLAGLAGLFRLRGEAELVIDEMACGCDRGPVYRCRKCWAARCPEHYLPHDCGRESPEWDRDVDDAVQLTHERRDDEESNDTAADFLLWSAELAELPGVHKYRRRMDRWSQ